MTNTEDDGSGRTAVMVMVAMVTMLYDNLLNIRCPAMLQTFKNISLVTYED